MKEDNNHYYITNESASTKIKDAMRLSQKEISRWSVSSLLDCQHCRRSRANQGTPREEELLGHHKIESSRRNQVLQSHAQIPLMARWR